MQALGEPQKIPSRPLIEIGARAMMRRELWKNRHEA